MDAGKLEKNWVVVDADRCTAGSSCESPGPVIVGPRRAGDESLGGLLAAVTFERLHGVVVEGDEAAAPGALRLGN